MACMLADVPPNCCVQEQMNAFKPSSTPRSAESKSQAKLQRKPKPCRYPSWAPDDFFPISIFPLFGPETSRAGIASRCQRKSLQPGIRCLVGCPRNN